MVLSPSLRMANTSHFIFLPVVCKSITFPGLSLQEKFMLDECIVIAEMFQQHIHCQSILDLQQIAADNCTLVVSDR